jgi:hypothetical protein
MAGAGVGTGQDYPTPIDIHATPADPHLLVSSLQRAGLSPAGAQQFSQGQAVVTPADRLALAAMMTYLLKGFRRR